MSESNPYAAKSEAKPVAVEVEVNEAEKAEEVPTGTVSEMLAWVGDDKNRAQAALDAEKEGAERVTLIHALEDLLSDK
jgi:hypothetical protein